MALASEILARSFEESKGPFPNLSDRDVVSEFLALDNEIGLLRTLQGLNAADKAVTEKRNAILIFTGSGELEVINFRDATDAIRTLFEMEKLYPEKDIVLVRADTSEELRLAFKNYFSDARDFIDLVHRGCADLSGAKKISNSLVKATSTTKRAGRTRTSSS